MTWLVSPPSGYQATLLLVSLEEDLLHVDLGGPREFVSVHVSFLYASFDLNPKIMSSNGS